MYLQPMSILATNPFCGFSTGFFNPIGYFFGFMNPFQLSFAPTMGMFQYFQNIVNMTNYIGGQNNQNNNNVGGNTTSYPILPFTTPILPAPISILPNFGAFSTGSVMGLTLNNTQSNPSSSVSSSNSTDSQDNTTENYSSNTMTKIKNSSLMRNVSPDLKSQILSAVDRACKKYNVDPKLVISIMYVESRFNPRATGPYINKIHDRAKGLMQLIPSTAKRYGANNPYDIEENIFAGVKFISELSKRYNGNRTLIAAAYNAGPRNVKNTVPDIGETKKYVVNVNRAYSTLG